jgi:hypothetical protein
MSARLRSGALQRNMALRQRRVQVAAERNCAGG